MTDKRDHNFLLMKKEEWEQRSLVYHLRYLQEENPEAFGEFIQASPFTSKEEWFIKAIMKLKLEDQHKTVEKVFTRNFMIASRVDRFLDKGFSEADAFKHVSPQNIGLTGLSHVHENQGKKISYTTTHNS
jgi:hypothetical protein